ncbi:MAG: LuxR C-terminal-related transcriptional regulator [Pseudomonadota bacterium]
MPGDLNDVIDIVDRIRSANSEAELCANCLSVLKDFGADAVSIGRAPAEDLRSIGVLTSLGDNFMGQYIAGGIFERDPWMVLCKADTRIARLETELSIGSEGYDPEFVSFMHSHGIRHATLVPSSSGAYAAGTVLLARHKDSAERLRMRETETLTLIASAIVYTRLESVTEPSAGLRLYHTKRALSAREGEALQWLATGRQIKHISEKMGIQQITVRKHLASARTKLGARTREQALAKALSEKLISL